MAIELTQELRDRLLLETYKTSLYNKALLYTIYNNSMKLLTKADNPTYLIPVHKITENYYEQLEIITQEFERMFPELAEWNLDKVASSQQDQDASSSQVKDSQ